MRWGSQNRFKLQVLRDARPRNIQYYRGDCIILQYSEHLIELSTSSFTSRSLASHNSTEEFQPMSNIGVSMPENFQTEDNLLFVAALISFGIDL